MTRFMKGYRWQPWTPYATPLWLRIWRGVHNHFDWHYPSRDGSWSQGYRFVCGGCGMDVK